MLGSGVMQQVGMSKTLESDRVASVVLAALTLLSLAVAMALVVIAFV